MPDKRFFIGVKALITNREGNILIMKKVPRKTTDKWKPFWDIPGGKMQEGDIKETLIREVKEELGIDSLEIGSLFDVAIANFDLHDGDKAIGGLLFLIYNCTIPANAKLKLSEEHSEYKWASAEQAKELLAYMLPKHSLEKIVVEKI